jgi:hypothetical protein
MARLESVTISSACAPSDPVPAFRAHHRTCSPSRPTPRSRALVMALTWVRMSMQ